jgi:hypothetical protein
MMTFNNTSSPWKNLDMYVCGFGMNGPILPLQKDTLLHPNICTIIAAPGSFQTWTKANLDGRPEHLYFLRAHAVEAYVQVITAHKKSRTVEATVF